MSRTYNEQSGESIAADVSSVNACQRAFAEQRHDSNTIVTWSKQEEAIKDGKRVVGEGSYL